MKYTGSFIQKLFYPFATEIYHYEVDKELRLVKQDFFELMDPSLDTFKSNSVNLVGILDKNGKFNLTQKVGLVRINNGSGRPVYLQGEIDDIGSKTFIKLEVRPSSTFAFIFISIGLTFLYSIFFNSKELSFSNSIFSSLIFFAALVVLPVISFHSKKNHKMEFEKAFGLNPKTNPEQIKFKWF